MKKRVLMSLVVLAIIGTSAVFAQQPTLDKLEMSAIKSNTEYQVRPLNSKISGEVVIPATYNNKPVTSVHGFFGCGEITSVTIPAGVTLGANAFNTPVKLTSITFQGSDIKMGASNSLPTNLKNAYEAYGAGTYTRSAGGTNWTKQGGNTLSGTYTRSDGTQITITDSGQTVTITGNYPNNGGRINETLRR